jgi:hypothetical protein
MAAPIQNAFVVKSAYPLTLSITVEENTMRIIGWFGLIAFLLGGCGGIHFFDKREVPTISISEGLRPTISWTPSNAYELNVYEGEEDGNGFGVLWTAKMPGGFANTLQSPVVYGVPPDGSEVREAPPLERGKTYTVTLFRVDPKGGGDGFFNTRHRYQAQFTFVASGDE